LPALQGLRVFWLHHDSDLSVGFSQLCVNRLAPCVEFFNPQLRKLPPMISCPVCRLLTVQFGLMLPRNSLAPGLRFVLRYAAVPVQQVMGDTFWAMGELVAMPPSC